MDLPTVVLRLRVRTPHGAPVTGARVALASGERQLAVEEPDGTYVLGLDHVGDYHLFVGRFGAPDGFDHRTFRATLFFRPAAHGGPPELCWGSPPRGQTSTVGLVERVAGGFVAELSLDYLWFTPVGYPPTLGNRAAVLIDGEEAWGAVADAIDEATDSIHVTTWIYEPTTELRRPSPVSDPDEREHHTVQRLLEDKAADGVTVRLLLWDTPVVGIPDEARERGEAADDHFEVLQESNVATSRVVRSEEYPLLSALIGEQPLYSFHQKTVVVDGRVGFCGGMNLKENDWDTQRHGLFDPKRARFDRPRAIRSLIASALQLADHPPRHDFIARVEGPAVAHMEANFAERWERLRDARVAHAQNSTPVAPPAAHPPVGPHAVQVVRTMPPPASEKGILDVYLRAIGAARRLVYIEDQYFRSTAVSDALADAVRAWPDLAVIVVTQRSNANDLFAGGWCWEGFSRIQRRKPDFELYTLEVSEPDHAGAAHAAEVEIHAKMMLVDDLFLTVGSCNVNDRGFELEGEMNLAIADATLARETRLRLWREHLADDPRITGDLTRDVAVWREHAERNRQTGGTVYRVSNVVPFTPTERAPLFDRRVF